MPFKDIEKQKEYHRDLMRKQRQGVTKVSQAVIEDVTPIESAVSQKVTQGVTQPVTPDEARINAIKKELDNPQLCLEIEAICVYFQHKRPNDTRLARFERALEYNRWLRKNPKPTQPHPVASQPYPRI